MLLFCQFYLTLPELQDFASVKESQPISGTLEPDQCSTPANTTALFSVYFC